MDRRIQLAWFSAASARYLDLGLTVEQRMCVFLECLQEAMSYVDEDLVRFCFKIIEDLQQKATKMIENTELGHAHLEKKEYDNAILYSTRCLDIAQECGGHKVAELKAHVTLGTAHLKKEEYDDAISHSMKWLDIAQACGDKVAERNAYYALGIAHLNKKKYDDAILYSKKCLAIAQKYGDKKAEMNAYKVLGSAYLNKGEFDDAISCSEKCLPIAQERGDKEAEINAYNTLGETHLKKEEYDDAISYSKKCLDIAQKCDDKVAEMNAYCTLVEAQVKKKKYDDAISNSKICLGISQERGDKKTESNVCLTLGTAHWMNNESDDNAILYYEKCLGIAQVCDDKNTEIEAHFSLGGLYLVKQEYDLSYKYLSKGLEIAKDLQSKKVLDFHIVLKDLFDEIGLKERPWTEDEFTLIIKPYIDSCTRIDKVPLIIKEQFLRGTSKEKADILFKLALVILVGNDHLSSRQTLIYKYSISELYRSQREYDTAIQHYKETLDLAGKTKNSNIQAKCHFGVGKIHYKRKEFKDAEVSFKESMDFFEFMFDNLGQNDRFKIAFVDKYRKTYKMLLKVLIQENKKEEALLLSERYRARALKDLLISSYGMKKEETGKRSLHYSDVQTLVSKNNYALLFYSTCFGKLYTYLIKKSEELKFSFQHFEYCDTCLDKLVDKAFDKMRVRQVVSCEGKFLEAMDDIEEDKNLNPEEDELTQLLSRVEEKRLSEQCRTICYTRGEPLKKRKKGGTTRFLGILYDKLIHEVKNSINEDEIVIIPEGPLNKVPFAALWDPDTRQYLSETKRIRLAPSMTTLKLIQECPVNHYSDRGALIIGDPLVGRVMINGKEDEPFGPLPGARQEAIDIAGILGDHPLLESEATKPQVVEKLQKSALIIGNPNAGLPFPCAGQEAKTIAENLDADLFLLGSDATKPKVIEKLKKGVSVVHIAAHGSLDKATIVLAPSKETRAAKEIPQEEEARAKKIPEEEDYMLTMADVQQAQVRAQLVVLSCCYSGRGEIRAEGVVGMCRAFIASGARAVVASLWAIDDEATLIFMRMFYTYLKERKSASTSLHLTMKDMREKTKYSKEKYWAPFFLMGDDVTIEL